MAKRKKTTKRKSSRRRMGAIKQDKLMRGVGVVGGLLLTAFVNDKVAAMEKPIDPLILAAGEVIAGFMLPEFVGKGNPLVDGIGLGMMGAGGLNALKETGAISGLTNVVNGWNQLGYNQFPQKTINGLPEVVQKFASDNGGSMSASSQVINGFFRESIFDESHYGM